ncbi:MAG: serine/threonine-protein kinase, partial [Polyangiales bacterium]
MAERPRSSTQPELDPLIGLTVSGRYRVHALIGQGGMGKVFRAQQIPLGRAVALKVLEAARVDQEFQRRFFQEAAILAKLQSRHTVTIFDYGRDGDLYFIAMELISGSSLDRVIASQGPLPWPRALSIAQQICRSLREAHAQGVIHRDLKPANVVITQTEDGDELAKVLDFGLAKRIDRVSTEDTQADTVPGSPKYMAPEVIRQQAVDGRADMYGLGVMLYQMLTGVVPFDRENPMDILIAHLHEQPRPPREVNPKVEIPGQLQQIVMRCLAKTPGERFADMATLLETLR